MYAFLSCAEPNPDSNAHLRFRKLVFELFSLVLVRLCASLRLSRLKLKLFYLCLRLFVFVRRVS